MFNFLKLKSKNKIGGHKIRTKGIIIGFCWVIIASTVISAVLPSYQAFADMSNIVYRTQAYFYSQALKGCLSSAANYVDSYTEGTMGQGDKQTVIKISDSNASKGVWFNADIKTYPSYLGNDNGVKTCNGVLKSLASLWGYEKYSGSSDSLMCELMDKSGIEYRSSTTKGSCENGNEDFNFGSLIPGTTNSNLTKLVEGVDKLNKSKGFSWEADSGAANWYTMYLADLKTGCNLVETTDTNVTNLYTVKLVDTSTGTVTNTYFEGSPLDTKIKAYTNNDQKVITQTCQEVLDNVNKRSDKAAVYFGINPISADDYAAKITDTSTDEKGSTDEPTCGSSVKGVGWIVCPLINAITGLNDTLWAIVSSLLNINPLSQSDSIYSAWQIIRNIANIVFVIFFMIIIFSQVTSIGISNYGVKKLLPRLIVCAILVNVSFLLIQIAVDLSNIIGVSLYDLLNSLVKDSSTSTWSHLIGLALSGITVAGVALLAGGPAAAFWILFPAAIAGLIGLLSAFLTLVVRQAIIPILSILAPLAIVAYLLPNTESLFKKWKNLFIPMLMMYPLAAIIFGGCKVAASIIISGNSDDFFQVLVGLIVMTLPLFSLPFLVKNSGTILSTVGNKLGKVAEKINSPIRDYSKSHRDLEKAKYLASERPRRGPSRWIHGAAKGIDTRRMTRENNTKGYQQQRENQYREEAMGAMEKTGGNIKNLSRKERMGGVKRNLNAFNSLDRMQQTTDRKAAVAEEYGRYNERQKAITGSEANITEMRRRSAANGKKTYSDEIEKKWNEYNTGAATQGNIKAKEEEYDRRVQAKKAAIENLRSNGNEVEAQRMEAELGKEQEDYNQEITGLKALANEATTSGINIEQESTETKMQKAYEQASQTAKETIGKDYAQSLKNGEEVVNANGIVQSIAHIAGGNVDSNGKMKAQAIGENTLIAADKKNVDAVRSLDNGNASAFVQAGIRVGQDGKMFFYEKDATTGEIKTVREDTDETKFNTYMKGRNLGSIEGFSQAGRESLQILQDLNRTPAGATEIATQLARTGQLTSTGLSDLIDNMNATPAEKAIALESIQEITSSTAPYLSKNTIDNSGKLKLGGMKGGMDKYYKSLIDEKGIAEASNKDALADKGIKADLVEALLENLKTHPESFKQGTKNLNDKQINLIVNEIIELRPGLKLSAADLTKEFEELRKAGIENWSGNGIPAPKTPILDKLPPPTKPQQ